MKIQEVKTGQFFTIGETPSYPKLKTDYGYIDARDEIKNGNITAIMHDVRIMEDTEVFEQFKKYGAKNLSEIEELRSYLFNL